MPVLHILPYEMRSKFPVDALKQSYHVDGKADGVQ